MCDFIIETLIYQIDNFDNIPVETITTNKSIVDESLFLDFLLQYTSSTEFKGKESAVFDILCNNKDSLLLKNNWESFEGTALYLRKHEALAEIIKKASSESDDQLILELDFPKGKIKKKELERE